MPDYITCGICGIDYELNDISQFIVHKSSCGPNNSHNIPFPSKNILECVKCFRKFNTPWSLLLHIQLDHKTNIVRNLCLPDDRANQYNNNNNVSQQQTTSGTQKTSLRTIETQTRTTSVQKAKCMAVCCKKSADGCDGEQCCTGCDKDDCSCNMKPTCCLPSQEFSESSQSPPHHESPTCCPCPHPVKVETKSTDCQTDFEYLDFDMDFLLDDGNITSNVSSTTLQQADNGVVGMMSSQPLSVTLPNIGLSNQYEISPYVTTSIPDPMNTISMMESSDVLSKNSTSQSLRGTEPSMMWPEGSLVNAMNEENSLSIIEHQIEQNDTMFQTLATTNSIVQQPVASNSVAVQNGIYSFSSLPQQSSMLDHRRILNSNDGFEVNVTRALSAVSPMSSQHRRMRDYRFTCSQCGKRFRQNVHLRKHTMSQHTKIKPHECPHCGYTTVEKSHLTVHIRTHTGEKPYRCRNCTYSSAQNCTLKSHYLRRHPGSSVICPSCGEGYITEQERNNHQKACKETSIP